MTSTHQKIEKYIGFNLDATIANEIQLLHVPSYRGCDYCEYVVKECPKNNRYEPDDKTRCPDGTNHVAINQLFCQFNRIIIDGVTYDRHRKEKPSIFESCEMMTPGFINRHRGSRCNGCGVPMGFASYWLRV